MKQVQYARSWSSRNAVNYYTAHRDTVDELYPSERYFIKDLLRKGSSLLDIGCAAGGFSKIAKGCNKGLEYTGVDISPDMIRQARRRFPRERFYLSDGENLDFADDSFDICVSLGVLHMTEAWKRLLAEAWRVCRDTLLFDLRLVDRGGVCDPKISYQRMEFGGRWDGTSKAPYIVVNVAEALRVIKGLEPKVKTLKSYGYWHRVSAATVSTFDEVYMSVFCLEKITEGENRPNP